MHEASVRIGIGLLLWFPLMPRSARAEPRCGSTSARWNVPAGAAVFSRGTGPVREVIDALGESRSHSMLSHGPDTWISHATMVTPSRSKYTTPFSGFCYQPIKANELRDGYPGGSQVDAGGVYTYLYGGGTNEYVYYQSGDEDGTNPGDRVQQFLWWETSVTPVRSRVDRTQTLWLINNSAGTARTNYSLYQFRDLEYVNEGYDAWNNGLVCSTLLAWAQARSGVNVQEPRSYSHDVITRAARDLYAAVFDECETSIGFWGKIKASVSCPFTSVCDRAANQVVNCMATGACSDGGSRRWKSVLNDANSSAVSISPDCVAGWNGCPFVGPGASVWAYDDNNLVQWNADGNQYGCWE